MGEGAPVQLRAGPVLPPASPVLPPAGTAGLFMLAAGLASTSAPLLTYSVSLALFGTAHVFSELRFVEARFASRLGSRLAWGLGLLLAGVVAIRLAKRQGWWGGTDAVQAELVLVAALGALVLPALSRLGLRPLLIGLGVVGALGVGLVAAPAATMLTLACLHNWTPVGFLAEGLPTTERRWGLVLGGLAFLVLPLLIASGLPGQALAAAGAWLPEATLLPTGPLSKHLGTYLPPDWHQADFAIAAFSALVFAQCMHYGAVIGVLPRIAPGGPEAPVLVGLSRLPARSFLVGVLVLTAVGLVGYGQDFADTRRWYGLIAAVHAWIEVPVLLLALAPLTSRTP